MKLPAMVLGIVVLLCGFAFYRQASEAREKHAVRVAEDAQTQQEFYEKLKATNEAAEPPTPVQAAPVFSEPVSTLPPEKPPAPPDEIAPEATSPDFNKWQRDHGLVLWKGDWVKPEEREEYRRQEEETKQPRSTETAASIDQRLTKAKDIAAVKFQQEKLRALNDKMATLKDKNSMEYLTAKGQALECERLIAFFSNRTPAPAQSRQEVLNAIHNERNASLRAAGKPVNTVPEATLAPSR